MTARIIIVERTGKDLIDRISGWRWFWMTVIPGRSTRSGFARTSEKARQRAERAAREMADLAEESVERYEYDPRPA